MKSTKTTFLGRASAVLLGLLFGAPLAQADDPFDLDEKEYTAGVRLHGIDEDTRIVGWKLSDNLYFGRRKGGIDDFGFILTRGDTQYSFTEDGIGWKKSISLFR
jgi:hypothetical protein